MRVTGDIVSVHIVARFNCVLAPPPVGKPRISEVLQGPVVVAHFFRDDIHPTAYEVSGVSYKWTRGVAVGNPEEVFKGDHY